MTETITIMHARPAVLSLLLLLLNVSPALAVSMTADERAQARRWMAAKFEGQAERKSTDGYLTVKLKHGPLLKNAATTRVYHLDLGALPLRIVDKEYRRGIYCPTIGKVVVHLPGPGSRFDAIFGVDSNRVTSFYSNAGRGRVIGTVEVNGKQAYRSEVMREGMPGVPVTADLEGATEFTLDMSDAGGGVVEQVDFNQADWVEARVTLKDGRTIWLGDLAIGPLRSAYDTEPPFSFRYGGRDSSEFLKTWKLQRSVEKLDDNRTGHTLIYSDPKTGLEVRCVGVEYQDFPVVEWTLHFKNTGDQPTPILEDILALDTRLERNNEGEFLLHHSNGSPHSLVKMSDLTAYAPREPRLDREPEMQLGSKLGLPASHDLPFFNVEWPDEGVVVAVGWPGQWAATLTRDRARGLALQAGQELTHFKLLPGEEVRAPRIAMLFWKGDDWLRAQNLWRRWMMAHNMPRVNGELPPAQHAASSAAYTIEMADATEENQLMFINRHLEKGIKPDYWWIDAGWYEYEDYWFNVDTWTPNRERFPRGLRPLSDHLHANGMKLILWFSPEGVKRDSWLDENHPEFILKGGAEWWMGHALLQGEVAGHVNDSGLTLVEDVACFGIGSPTTTVTGKTFLADGKWHLVTATRSIKEKIGESHIKLYVDGKLEASAKSPNIQPMDSNDAWGVGRQYQTRGIRADMDDVRVYDVALRPEEVEALYQGGDVRAPAHRYSFDGTIHDVAGGLESEHIGKGEFVFVQGASGRPDDKALRFNDDYGVKIWNKTPHSFTLSCWVRMDAPQPPPWGRGDIRLLDLGNSDALKWATDHVDGQITEQGVDLYRHDGIPTLAYWRSNDAEDRQGISEIRHVEGLLEYFDELRRRHPDLRLDICAGGGARNELEILRRAVPRHRSDYAYETTGMQTLTYGMSLWYPYFGSGTNASDRYTFRSQIAPALSSMWDVRRHDVDYAFVRRMLSQWRQITDYYYGDFYPLTAYRTENDVWMAWQFNRPESGQGMVQAFRRPKSPAVGMKFKLQGLDATAQYSVTNFDVPGSKTFTGKELLESGLLVPLEQPRDAALIVYKRLD